MKECCCLPPRSMVSGGNAGFQPDRFVVPRTAAGLGQRGGGDVLASAVSFVRGIPGGGYISLQNLLAGFRQGDRTGLLQTVRTLGQSLRASAVRLRVL